MSLHRQNQKKRGIILSSETKIKLYTTDIGKKILKNKALVFFIKLVLLIGIEVGLYYIGGINVTLFGVPIAVFLNDLFSFVKKSLEEVQPEYAAKFKWFFEKIPVINLIARWIISKISKK